MEMTDGHSLSGRTKSSDGGSRLALWERHGGGEVWPATPVVNGLQVPSVVAASAFAGVCGEQLLHHIEFNSFGVHAPDRWWRTAKGHREGRIQKLRDPKGLAMIPAFRLLQVFSIKRPD